MVFVHWTHMVYLLLALLQYLPLPTTVPPHFLSCSAFSFPLLHIPSITSSTKSFLCLLHPPHRSCRAFPYLLQISTLTFPAELSTYTLHIPPLTSHTESFPYLLNIPQLLHIPYLLYIPYLLHIPYLSSHPLTSSVEYFCCLSPQLSL